MFLDIQTWTLQWIQSPSITEGRISTRGHMTSSAACVSRLQDNQLTENSE